MIPLKTIELQVQRTINASPEAVFEAWLDIQHPGSPWFGVAKAIVNPPRPEALFYSMYTLEGREIAHYGRFIALEKPHRIQYTWVSEATHGMESIVTISLIACDSKTQVTIVHSHLPNDDGGRFHQNAWGYVLGQMAKRFRSGDAQHADA